MVSSTSWLSKCWRCVQYLMTKCWRCLTNYGIVMVYKCSLVRVLILVTLQVWGGAEEQPRHCGCVAAERRRPFALGSHTGEDRRPTGGVQVMRRVRTLHQTDHAGLDVVEYLLIWVMCQGDTKWRCSWTGLGLFVRVMCPEGTRNACSCTLLGLFIDDMWREELVLTGCNW